MPGTFSPPPRVSDTDMHQSACVTHVPWCMPRSLTSSFLLRSVDGKTCPTFPGHAHPAILPYLVKGPWSTKSRENLETQHLKDNNARGTICIWSFYINVTDRAIHWKICKKGIEKNPARADSIYKARIVPIGLANPLTVYKMNAQNHS